MQQIAMENSRVSYLFVAVDTCSRIPWIIGVTPKTSEVFTDSLEKIIATKRQRKTHKIHSSKNLSKKVWAAKVKENAGNVSQSCKKNGIETHYTGSEENWAMEERYIRTLKTIICR